MFGQTPKPAQIAIGRSALKPTLIASSPRSTRRANISYTYSLTVGGKGFADTVTFTSDGTPTDAEYATLASPRSTAWRQELHGGGRQLADHRHRHRARRLVLLSRSATRRPRRSR
jgi:hypothetical protein